MSHPVCTICLEIIIPNSELIATFCGHTFHSECLTEWVKLRKTCPQCRAAVDLTKKPCIRLFLVYGNNPVEDASTLQLKYDNLKFENTLKDKDIKDYKEKYIKSQEQLTALKSELKIAENQIRSYESTQHILKDKIAYFKSRGKDCDKLSEEIVNLKKQIQNMKSLNTALEGSKEELHEMLRNISDPKTMATMIASLKQALVDLQRSSEWKEAKYRNLETELNKLKRKYIKMLNENRKLRVKDDGSPTSSSEKSRISFHSLDGFFSPCQSEKNKFAKNTKPTTPTASSDQPGAATVHSSTPIIILDDSGSGRETNSFPTSTSLDKTFEFLTSMQPGKSKVSKFTVSQPVKTQKPTDTSTKIQISQNFLPCKANTQTKVLIPNSVSSVSIFRKHKQPRIDDVGTSRKDDMMYNGLGGQSKEDIFPSSLNKRRRVTPVFSRKI